MKKKNMLVNYSFTIFAIFALIGGFNLSNRGTIKKSTPYENNEQKTPEGYDITKFDIGLLQSGAVVNDGTNDHLYMWGENHYDQPNFGSDVSNDIPKEFLHWDGDNTNGNQSLDELYPSGYEITDFSIGNEYSAAIINDGINDHLYMWGDNDFGQLGLGNEKNYSIPQEVLDWDGNNTNGNQSLDELYPSGYEITDFSLGAHHSGIIVNDRTSDHLYMWGYNSNGQLGLGDDTDYNTPQEVIDWDGDNTNGNQELTNIYPSGYEITDLSLGFEYSGVVINDGTSDHLYMWGDNDYGQLGLGSSVITDDPSGVKLYKSTPQKVLDWDGNDTNGNQSLSSIYPSGYKITDLALGNSHSGIVVNVGTNDHLYMWGSNSHGKLGVGNDTDYNTPQEVIDWDGNDTNGNQSLSSIYPEGYEITDFSLGFWHSGIVVNDGTSDHLYMWGDDYYGQLGLGDDYNEFYYNNPQEVLHINSLVFNHVEETTITETSFEFSFYFYNDDYEIDPTTNVVVELIDENGQINSYDAKFITSNSANDSYQFEINNLNSEGVYNFKSIKINDDYLADNINQKINLDYFNFVAIDQNSITDTSFDFIMNIDEDGYNGVMGDQNSNLEVGLTVDGVNIFYYEAELIAINGTTYNYRVNGLELGVTYELVSVDYNNNEYLENVNDIQIFIHSDSNILFISSVTLGIILFLILILVIVKVILNFNLRKLKSFQNV